MDEAKNKDIQINVKELSKELGIPVVPTIALKKEGIDKLIEVSVSDNIKKSNLNINYGDTINNSIKDIKGIIDKSKNKSAIPSNWAALKLLENDDYMKKQLNIDENKALKDELDKCNKDIEEEVGFEGEMAIVNERYSVIGDIVAKSVVRNEKHKETITDKIDKVVTNK